MKKENLKAYIILGTVALLSIVAFIGIKLNYFNSEEMSIVSTEDNTRIKESLYAEAYPLLYADAEDPTLYDKLYIDDEPINAEVFKKYQVCNVGEDVTYCETHMPVGNETQIVGGIRQQVSVISMKTYDDKETLKLSVSSEEELLPYMMETDLEEGCKYVVIEYKINNLTEIDNLIFPALLVMGMLGEDCVVEKYEEYDENGDIKSYDIFATQMFVFNNNTVFCNDVNAGKNEGFNYVPIEKEDAVFHYTDRVLLSGNDYITIKGVYMLPRGATVSNKLYFGSQAIGVEGKSGYSTDRFAVMVNK